MITKFKKCLKTLKKIFRRECVQNFVQIQNLKYKFKMAPHYLDFITKKEAERLIQKKDKREKENIEIISKKDFLKELEIIVNAYEDIYNDNEVEKIFENFKENF